MRNLYLVRHGQASFGTADYDRLSPLGARQSRLAGEWFKRCDIDIHHVVAGGLKRHIQTAEAFLAVYDGEGSRRKIHRDPAFNEIDQLDILNPTHTRADKALADATTSKPSRNFARATSVTHLRWERERFVLRLFNSTAHLDHHADASLLTLA